MKGREYADILSYYGILENILS